MRPDTQVAVLSLLVVALVSGPQVRAEAGRQFIASADAAVVIGDDSANTVRVLAELKTARALMKLLAVGELPPLRVFVVSNQASLRELVPQYWERRGVRPAGASYTGPHAAFIAIRTDIPAAQRFPLLLHEYVHLLTTAHLPDAPAWLDEGLSEFWSALVLEGPHAVIGRPPARHLKQLRARAWLTAEEMAHHRRGTLEADEDRAQMFYAQSWAMVHYLLLGASQAAPLPFAPPDQQWTPQLDSALRVYVNEGRFHEVAIPSPRPDETMAAARAITEARALAERANMLVFGARPDAAVPVAHRALSLDPREPLALEVLGTHSFLHNQPDQAKRWLSQALDADPERSSAALYLALLSTSTADRERYLQAAVKAKPDLEVAWQRLAALYAEDGRAAVARRWCIRLVEQMQPWLWADQLLRCQVQEQ